MGEAARRDDGRPEPDPGHLLTIDEAAAFLNVPARWVSEAVRQRRVRCTRIGKHVRFRLEHLEELVTAGEQPTASPALRAVSQLSRDRRRSRL